MTRLAHLSKTINIFVPVAGSPRDAGDRAAASRNKSASAPPRAWKEKETQDYFFARPQPQASSTPAALPFTRGRPGHRRALTGAGPAATAPGPCVSRVPSPRPSDPQTLTGSPGTMRRSSALRRRTVHAGSALRRRSGWRRAGLRTSSETRGRSAMTRT